VNCCNVEWKTVSRDIDQVMPGTNIITTVLTEISECPECGGRYLTDKQADWLIKTVGEVKGILKTSTCGKLIDKK